MIEHSKIQEAVQAREELAKRMASLGSVPPENTKIIIGEVVTGKTGVSDAPMRPPSQASDSPGALRPGPLTLLVNALTAGLARARQALGY